MEHHFSPAPSTINASSEPIPRHQPPHKCQELIINDRLVLNERFMLQKGCSALSRHSEGFRALTAPAHQLRPGEMSACNGLAVKAMTAVGEVDDRNKKHKQPVVSICDTQQKAAVS